MQVGTTKHHGLYNKPSAAVHPGALAAGTLPQYNTNLFLPVFENYLSLKLRNFKFRKWRSVCTHQTPRRHIPVERNLQYHGCDNLKSRIAKKSLKKLCAKKPNPKDTKPHSSFLSSLRSPHTDPATKLHIQSLHILPYTLYL